MTNLAMGIHTKRQDDVMLAKIVAGRLLGYEIVLFNEFGREIASQPVGEVRKSTEGAFYNKDEIRFTNLGNCIVWEYGIRVAGSNKLIFKNTLVTRKYVYVGDYLSFMPGNLMLEIT